MTRDEYDALKRTIDYHMDRYYNQDAPVISDFEYDQLMQQLKSAEREHPEWVTPDSPSQKIGGSTKRDPGVKVTHDVPMLSIEDVFTKEDVRAWVEKVHEVHPGAKFSVETKIDGLSMTVRYRRGEDGRYHLYLAETRGDGLIGEDVTVNARVIPDVREEINLSLTASQGVSDGADQAFQGAAVRTGMVSNERGTGTASETAGTEGTEGTEGTDEVTDDPAGAGPIDDKKDNDNLELRGEVYMTHEDFARYNREMKAAGKRAAANPRNLAAGTLRQLDASITKKRGLRMFIFNVQSGPSDMMDSHTSALDRLAAAGVPVVHHQLCGTAEEVIAAIDEIGGLRSGIDYDLDGAVVKIDHIAWRNDFPAGAKYSSGHIAYKYPPEERVVTMDRIIVDVGRTGKLTFTGEFHDSETGEPARLAGTSVSRATLHNPNYIREMKIGVGGQYRLFKSGEIIPKLNGCVKEPPKVFEPPERCPVCGEPLFRDPESADIRCINPSCPAQLTRTIAYFASRTCMNIMGLGDTLIDALVREGFLTNYADIYHLKDHRTELIEKGIIGKEKNTDKVLANIEASKQNSPVLVLAGLGIRNCGISAAREIMKYFPDIEALSEASMEKLVEVPDIGETTAQCIRDFFRNETNRKVLQELKDAGVNMTMPAAVPASGGNGAAGTSDAGGSAGEGRTGAGKLAGLTIVITGTLKTMGRREAEELVDANGGRATGSVSKKTSYLVAGEAAGSKLAKAQQLGVPVITEEELLKMVR